MHLCQLINIDVENVCVCGTDGRNKKKEEKKGVFVCLCAKIIDLLLGDPHLSSIGDGRGVPVGCMFQIAEEEEKNRGENSTFCSLSDN